MIVDTSLLRLVRQSEYLAGDFCSDSSKLLLFSFHGINYCATQLMGKHVQKHIYFLSTVLSSCFVGSLYLWRNKKRDEPSTIKLRFVSVSGVILIASCLVYLLRVDETNSFCEVVRLCPQGSVVETMLIPLGLTALLFLGPIVVLRDTYTWDEIKSAKLSDHIDWIFFRNYVVAPISEEFTFRSCLLAFLNPHWSRALSMIISSTFFSLAHSHHYFFQRLEGSRPVPLIAALVQLGYTFVFGMYSSFFISRTNFLLTSIMIHIFCNGMGFPDFEVLSWKKKYYYSTIFGAGMWLILLICYASL
ncbi:CAAX prenyl protease 2 [Halotydeus destructor]|nr:CAAX prenyl protease 2 [Halotydeus destructor]